MTSVLLLVLLISLVIIIQSVWVQTWRKRENMEDFLSEFIYLLILTIVTIKGILNSSLLFPQFPDIIDKMLVISVVFLLIMKVMSQRFDRRLMLIYGAVGVCCVMTSLIMRDFCLVYTYALIVGAQNVNIRRVLTVHMTFVGILLMIHMLWFGVTWLVDRNSLAMLYRNGEQRYSFMMIHPNNFAMYLLWTSLEWLYVRYENMAPFELVVLVGVNYFSYRVTGSRTAFLVLVFALVLFFLTRIRSNRIMRRVMRWLASYGFTLCLVFYAIIGKTYGKVGGVVQSIYDMINRLINGRLFLSAYVDDVYGFSVLGQQVEEYRKIHWKGYWFDQVYLDSAYSKLLWGYGIVYAILFAFLFWYTGKRVSLREHVFMVIYIIYSLSENYGMNAATCFVPIFIGMVIYQNQEKKELLPAYKRTKMLV